MGELKYCPACKRGVKPRKRFNWAVFIAITVFTLTIGTWCYLGYWIFKKKTECPICGATVSDEFGPTAEAGTKQTVIQREVTLVVCPSCGAKVEQGARKCPECGAKL